MTEPTKPALTVEEKLWYEHEAFVRRKTLGEVIAEADCCDGNWARL